MQIQYIFSHREKGILSISITAAGRKESKETGTCPQPRLPPALLTHRQAGRDPGWPATLSPCSRQRDAPLTDLPRKMSPAPDGASAGPCVALWAGRARRPCRGERMRLPPAGPQPLCAERRVLGSGVGRAAARSAAALPVEARRSVLQAHGQSSRLQCSEGNSPRWKSQPRLHQPAQHHGGRARSSAIPLDDR